jgi:hypothetical protein
MPPKGPFLVPPGRPRDRKMLIKSEYLNTFRQFQVAPTTQVSPGRKLMADLAWLTANSHQLTAPPPFPAISGCLDRAESVWPNADSRTLTASARSSLFRIVQDFSSVRAKPNRFPPPERNPLERKSLEQEPLEPNPLERESLLVPPLLGNLLPRQQPGDLAARNRVRSKPNVR